MNQTLNSQAWRRLIDNGRIDMTTLEQLLEEYQEKYNLFTYAHYFDPDNYNVLQTGLVACFYIDQGYLPQKRQAMGEVLALYHQYWGDKLLSGYKDDNPNNLEQYHASTLEEKINNIYSIGTDDLSIYWSSSPNLDYVADYLINIFSSAGWYEKVHKEVSFLKLYWPLSELKTSGIQQFIKFIQVISGKLQPMHGYAGLGVQHGHEYYDYQYLEYEIAHRFLGLDISNYDGDLRFRNGFKCINWLTILSDDLIKQKLGSVAQLQANNEDPAIKFYPYQRGIIVQAGEVPALGYIQENPYPKHYISVNALLKAARAPEIGSLGFGSVNGEIRFNSRTTTEWQARFDNVALPEENTLTISDSGENALEPQQKRITVKTGELCRFSGFYSANINGKLYYQELTEGYKVMPFSDEQDNLWNDITWILLRRDDGGNVYEQ